MKSFFGKNRFGGLQDGGGFAGVLLRFLVPFGAPRFDGHAIVLGARYQSNPY